MDIAAEYEPPCRAIMKRRVTCGYCGKRITLHTLRYRHLCVDAVERVRRAEDEARHAVGSRAESALQAEKRSKFARLFNL